MLFVVSTQPLVFRYRNKKGKKKKGKLWISMWHFLNHKLLVYSFFSYLTENPSREVVLHHEEDIFGSPALRALSTSLDPE